MVGPIRVQNGRTGSPLIAEAAATSGGVLFFVPVTGRHTINGQPSDDELALVVPGGADFTIAVHGRHEWLASFVPQELLGPYDMKLCRGWRGSRVLRPGREAISRLRSRLASVLQSAAVEPSILSEPAARAAIETELLASCRAVVAPDPIKQVSGRPAVSRAKIVQTVRELIEKGDDDALRVDALACAADVSVRTLQTAFLEYFGMPPHRYLLLRRLHGVREVLRKSDPEEITVTRVAAQFGFWQFGRFAGHYRRLFGELPSATLAQTASAGRRFCNLQSAQS